jgi:hypothetical protein
MKSWLLIFAALILMSSTIYAQSAKELAGDWEMHRISKIVPSDVRHADLKKYLQQLKNIGLKVGEVGKSFGGREIYQMEFGRGATRIFMWSQMHGDEPTATSALVDMFAYLQKNPDKKWVKEIKEKLTIRAVPMLNPDGAELFQRFNLQYIDINRDAKALSTPEGQLLKRLRDEWSPEIGFNLHNQNSLTTVGRTNKQATISFLAVLGNAEGKSNENYIRNKRLISVMKVALDDFIKGNIGRYDDTFNPRAFGDMFSAWGTPVILIETGALHGKDEMFLTQLNFIAYLSALKALVEGSEQKANPKVYEDLPFNSSDRIFNVIFRRANIINFKETSESFTADVGINKERRRAQILAPTYVREIGDLTAYKGLEEFDAREFYLVPRNGQLRIGLGGEFLFFKKGRKIDWKAENLEKTFLPDAIFSDGKWTKGEKFFAKKQ